LSLIWVADYGNSNNTITGTRKAKEFIHPVHLYYYNRFNSCLHSLIFRKKIKQMLKIAEATGIIIWDILKMGTCQRKTKKHKFRE